jgi:ribosome recycling factor
MNEDLELVTEETRESMEKSLQHLEHELSKIRAGKANPRMLEDVRVEYYGTPTPLNQVANINAPDAKSLTVQPFEKNMLRPVEKAIIDSNLGLNPTNDGQMVRINLPPLTEERRRQLVKRAKEEAEQAKIAIRGARKEGNEQIKKMVKEGLSEDEGKEGEDHIQQLTNQYIKKVEETMATKEEEIMKV